jgi:hypothetical protein
MQSNVDDMLIGVPEYALDYCGATAIEIKFGQSAKGIQHMEFIYSLDVALSCKQRGFLIFPDPEDEQVQAEFRRDNGLYFTLFGRLPMWDEETLAQRIKTYREHGARHIAFKMAGYDECDLRRVLTIASANRIDMVTVDGAGGGTGHSPCKMMNEWCQPTLPLLAQLTKILRAMRDRGETLPPVAITGGIASEDQIFKALAFGEDLVDYVAIGRAAMAAAMTAKNIGTQVKDGNTPPAYLNYGSDIAHVFRDAKRLAALYGVKPDALPPGAIGVYSYLSRLQTGLQQLIKLMHCPDRLIKIRGQDQECDQLSKFHGPRQNGLRSKSHQCHHSERPDQVHRGIVQSPNSHNDKRGPAQLVTGQVEAFVLVPLPRKTFDLANSSQIIVQKGVHGGSGAPLLPIPAMCR